MHAEAASDTTRKRRSSSEDPFPVRIRLLGGFSVWVGSRAVSEGAWRLRKARSLVKLLALAPGHRLHREQVMEALWPNLGMHKASNNLHQVLHSARRALVPSALASVSAAASSGYLLLGDEHLALCPDSPLWVDVDAFEEAVATARHAMEPRAYGAAIDLYAGELLPEDRYEPWVEERRAELRGLYLALLLELGALLEERGEFELGIEALSRVVAQEPIHEGAHVELMRLYALLGRRREALSQYEHLREALNKEFGTEPEATTTRLQQQIWAGSFSHHSDSPPGGVPAQEEVAPSAAGAARHNLPLARTSFVGREREKLEVKRLLAMTRLLTLTGAGGCGKTRLAVEVARDLIGAYPDGVWLVGLAPLSEAELVPQSVAQVFGAREQPNRPLLETLKYTLRTKKMLLVLDNCEHLLEAVVGLVDALLDSCPSLRILATSRETLNAAGEVTWVVPSLTMADAREPFTPPELEAYESVRLFVERARQRDPSFELSVRNAQAVAQACRHLEGIPLAIELAAARMGALSAEQLSERLDDPLKVLSTGGRSSDPRHRSLRATLEWSHELLSQPERVLFRRLSVFAGGWTLEAAEEVCSGKGIDEGEVLDLLSQLVDKSLVVTEAGYEQQGGTSRYRILEPIRQYARERLEESGETEALGSRHAASFVALAERAGPELRGPQQVVWLKRLETERDNVRGAMRWLLAKGESQTATRIGWALWLFWWFHGHFTEARRWMEEALAKGDAMPASARAKALFVAGTMAQGQADWRSAEPLLAESMTLFRELRDKLGSAHALIGAGLVAVGQGHPERGNALLQEGTDLFLKMGDRWYASVTLSYSAVGRFGQGDLIRAERLAEQGLELAREIGDPQATSIACYAGAAVAQAEGAHERAKELLQEGLKLSVESGDQTNVAHSLEGLAAAASFEGRLPRAARLWGAAEALLENIEAAAYIYAPDRSVYQDQVSAVRAQLDEEAWEAAWAKGRTMALEHAIVYALSEEREEHEPPTDLFPVPEQQPPPPADQQTETLTPREQEIALLVGRGLTNRQIALELSISERTVENHISKILKKLGFSSRARIATWVAHR